MNEIKGDIPQYIKGPDNTPTTPEKKDFISRMKEQLNALMGEIKGGISSPKTTVIENPPVSPTERPVSAGYTEVHTSQLPNVPTGTSAGGAAIPPVAPPAPAPLPPLQ